MKRKGNFGLGIIIFLITIFLLIMTARSNDFYLREQCALDRGIELECNGLHKELLIFNMPCESHMQYLDQVNKLES
jgi:hypothetical protein